ncbi:hypothetical protein BDN72DRAFT_963154 [Pluteus cervinus]|uniref:Uncharacterized protein n=1 Tax=Pluteus cervinus TaxID=181527 RepID=A0ACD3AGH6_9AGAR|nr:hypothetical protein BDN72DRAFT_963154 [Pluteus cervinus]
MEYLSEGPLNFHGGELPRIIQGARAGSLKELVTLAKIWESLPNPLGFHLIFLHHLNSSAVPTQPKSDIMGIIEGTEEGRAFWSLWGLGSMGVPLLRAGLKVDPCGQDIIKAWPGIFKWSAFFYTSHVQIDIASPQKKSMRGVVRDVIASCWCSLAFSESAKRAMLKTRGVIDIAARLWLFEDDPEEARVTQIARGIPIGTLLLKLLSDTDDEADWDNFISATSGNMDKIARISLSRLKTAFKAPKFASNPGECIAILSFIGRLCCSPKPEILQALLDNGVIVVCIKFLIRLASVVNEGSCSPDLRAEFVVPMTGTFRILLLCLEDTIGLPWVLQAANAGLITAFVECSPLFNDISHDDYTTVSATISNTIPRYLAYWGVVQAVDAAFLKLEKTERFLSLRRSKAWEAFNGLALLTARRFRLVGQYKQMKKKATTCSNPRCLKVDLRNTFRKCAKCRTAVYCSKECQTSHWSDSKFNHRRSCREPVTEPEDPEEYVDFSGHDSEYILLVNIYETRYNLTHLKHLAATEYPDTPRQDLVVVIDYNVVPMTCKLDLRSTWMQTYPHLFIFPRGGRLPVLDFETTTIIIGRVPYAGKGTPQYYVAPVPGGIWNWERGRREFAATDQITEIIEQRRKLYCGI